MASIEIKDAQAFGKAIKGCLVDIDQNQGLRSVDRAAWFNALIKAVVNIEGNDFLLHFDRDTEILVIFTATTSGQCYEVTANGCECKAWLCATPCWHRAARKLLVRYFKGISPAPSSKGAAAVAAATEPVVKSVAQAAPAHVATHANIREFNNAPYLKAADTKPVMKFGGFRI